ncbi:MAG: 3-phosphoserine/phosphohydroxythreonine transaminase [Capnocytophaga sp.]|nr:3-phosphoserine/phosphohydroxythreonine transaminase [Capnocytophaga sp.]
MKKHNFSAGPSILPAVVFEKASQAVLEFENTGLSILEISHRSKDFISVLERAKANVLELSGLKDKGYQVLFLHGGASMQFLMTAYNLLQNKAAYIDTGTWANKALKEAQLIGNVDVIASSKDNGYKNIPKNISVSDTYDYLHITTNNTIYGTQYQYIPETNIPLVADMSSDIFSREIPFEKFGLIYAGAQKNIGVSGTTLVIVREDILGKVTRKIPTLLDYQVHIKNESLANTPSTYAIYISYLTMEWIKEQGGCKGIEVKNKEKAEILYNEIDRNPLFKGYTDKEDRSMMNAVFTLADEKLTDQFDNLWKEAGISGIKGHRSIGGYRASIYNAMPLESVKLLVEVMQNFEKLQ